MSADSQFQGKRTIPFAATDQEISHGRDITWTLRAKEAPQHIRESWVGTSWILEMTATGTRDTKPFHATHLFLTSQRCSQEETRRRHENCATSLELVANHNKIDATRQPWSRSRSQLQSQESAELRTSASTGQPD